MQIFTIPLNQELPFYSFTSTLSGARYQLTARYNTRMDRWFLDIADATGAPVLSGTPLVIRRELLRQYSTLPLPPGVMFAFDDSGQELDPTIRSFLTDHSLYYATAT